MPPCALVWGRGGRHARPSVIGGVVDAGPVAWSRMPAPTPVLAATNPAFVAVFAVFVLALAVLAVVSIRWGVRHDRPGREAWKRRMQARIDPAEKEAAGGAMVGAPVGDGRSGTNGKAGNGKAGNGSPRNGANRNGANRNEGSANTKGSANRAGPANRTGGGGGGGAANRTPRGTPSAKRPATGGGASAAGKRNQAGRRNGHGSGQGRGG